MGGLKTESSEGSMNLVQRVLVGLFCTVLILYFIPMLIFIPLALFGGTKNFRSPFEKGYNNQTAARVWEEVHPHVGPWYWDPSIVACITAGVPITFVGSLLLYQKCSGSPKDDRA